MEELYRSLKAEWAAGDRDREAGLHLLFLAWMHWADPPFVTGMSEDPEDVSLWHEVFEHFGGEAASDPEFLYVAAIMAIVTPWGLGDETTWIDRSERMKARSIQLRPQGFSPAIFEGRGEYGRYFAHLSR